MKSSFTVHQQYFIVLSLLHWPLGVNLYQLTLRHPRYGHHGLVLPELMSVTVGYDVLLKLSKQLVNQQACTITTPAGVNFTTASLPSARYESWSDGCGVRIRNIQLSDEGRWRMTASRSDHTITGFSTVRVLNATTVTESTITLSDSTTDQQVNLTSLANSYCMVAKPFATSVLVQGHCQVTVDKVSRALQGVWNVQLALPGRVAEVPLQQAVTVEAERLDTGFVQDTTLNKLHIFCNILHTEKVISFCRFQRTAHSGQGYSVSDGLSDGDYSYYGEGFEQKHCGITIENPTAQDFTAWRCSVGVMEESGARSAMQGLVNINTQTSSVPARDRRDALPSNSESEDLRTVLSVNGTHLTVSCEADRPLSYCWFRVNNGSVWDFTPGTRVEQESEGEGQSMWYVGDGLEAGDCGVTIRYSHFSHTGVWTCHMGSRDLPGLELTEDINVRVTGHLAATHQVVRGQLGGSVTLHCKTALGVLPLDYCRFLSPQSVGLNLDSSVTASNAVLGRYYFADDAKLDQGDCSLTIVYITSEDVGTWTCASVVSGDTVESSDTMSLVIAGTLSIASIVGMSATAGVLLLGLSVYGTVKFTKRKRRNSPDEQINMQDMPAPPRFSTSSGGSEGSVTHFRADRERSSM